MSAIFNRGRRQFLRGTGAFALALPVLPSLLRGRALAQALTPLPRFIAMTTEHGAVADASMFPNLSMLSSSSQLYADHAIKQGALQISVEGGRVALSKVLAASPDVLTREIVTKLNVLRGVDVAFQMAHHQGGFLGNFADNEGTGPESRAVQGDKRPTIDQVMAWSSSFYRDLASTRERSIHIGEGGERALSWAHEDPSGRTGAIVPVPSSTSAHELFSRIFVASAPSDTAATRVPVVDRVLESYKRMRTSATAEGRRLSSEDRKRLDNHMDRLAELQRSVTAAASASCGEVSMPENMRLVGGGIRLDVDAMVKFYQVYNDVIVAGMICGTTRVATVRAIETFSPFPGDWHNDIAHRASDEGHQNILISANQTFFERVYLDLVNKLNVEEAEGKTYLDNSLVTWTQEAGAYVHDPISLPIIAAGSASGYFKTGNYVDYRNLQDTNLNEGRKPGILYNQWLGNILLSMGVPPSEFEYNGEKGYGLQSRRYDYAGRNAGSAALAWPDRLFADASKAMPLLKS